MLTPLEAMVLPDFKIDKPIRLIELFAGVGSQAMALRNIGADYTSWKVVEFDKYPVKSYNAIHGTDFKPTDIRNVHWDDLEVVDVDKYCYIMTYSFPCQDISCAGLQRGFEKGSGTRSGLLWEVERILTELKENGNLPQVLLMENVAAITGVKFADDLKKWHEFLDSIGYNSFGEVLNAKNYGVAQNRNRYFCVSILGGYNYTFPQPVELKSVMADYLDEEVDEKYYINSEKANQLIENLLKKNGGEYDFT